MVKAVSVSTAAVKSRTVIASPSIVGAVAPIQNLSFNVVGVIPPPRAELIFTLNVETPDVATTFTSLSMVTVPPDRPLALSVKAESLFDVAKDPAKPLLEASV